MRRDERKRPRGPRRLGAATAEAARVVDGVSLAPRRGMWFRGNVPGLLLAAIATVVACQPIAATDLWWELARGREVLHGHGAPSRALLANEVLADADWLGGVPILMAYRVAGASGLMAMRTLAAIAVAFLLWNRLPSKPWSRLLWTGGLLLAVAPALGPAAITWDLLGLICLGLLVRRWQTGHHGSWPGRWPMVAAIAGVMTLWANLGPRPLVGLLALAAWVVPGAPAVGVLRWRQSAVLLLPAVGACLLTPRGLATLSDSARLTFPAWTEQGAWLQDGPWQPSLTQLLSPQVAGFLLLTVLVISSSAARTGNGIGAGSKWVWPLVVAQLLAWQNVGNMALAGVLLVMAGGIWSWPTGSASEPHELSRASNKTPPASGPATWAHFVHRFSWGLGMVVLAGAVTVQAFGGIGWGMSQQLDIRFLDRALEGQRLEGTALGDGLVAAGMLAWSGRSRPTGDQSLSGLTVLDVPHRALLGGRLGELRALLEDLELGQRLAYERSDGSQGGWWLPLVGRDTSLLLVSAENTALIEGLAGTLWRPLALDGPVVPFAQAGAPALASKIVEVLKQQDFVETGGWVYQPPSTTSSEYDRDRWGLRPVLDDAAAARRQAGLFRALGLPRAALSVLRHLQRSGRASSAADLTRTVHADLAQEELRLAGRVSEFRRLVSAARIGTSMSEGGTPLAKSAVAYAAGDLSGALQALGDAQSPEDRYGRAVITLESGQRVAALQELGALAAEFPDTAVGIWAQALLDRIAWPAESLRPQSAGRELR